MQYQESSMRTVAETDHNVKGVYVIRIDFSDDTTVFPAKVERFDRDWESDLDEAEQYYRKLYKGKGIVSIEFANDIDDVTMPNTLSIKTWKFEKQRLIPTEPMNQKEKLLHSLLERGISPWVIALVEKNMEAEDNEQIFLEHVKLRYPQESVRKSLEVALEIAKEAHINQTQKRPQDPDGMDSIPYVNHPIQVATHILKHGDDTKVVEAALLHDVIEDTKYTEEDLRQRGVSEEVLVLLRDVTKQPNESREEYMKRVSKLKGASKTIKCFDRYDNLLRSFSIKDPAYIARYIHETEDSYLPYLQSQPDLSDLALQMEQLIEEMKKYRDSL